MERSWWYIGRAHVIAFLFSRTHKHARVLDFGAGFGGMIPWLSEQASEVDAYEPDVTARTELLMRGYANVLTRPEDAHTGVYDVVGLFDVVEHIENDEAFLKEIQKALAPNGSLVITVPAYMWLWSAHDTDNQHFRRYTKTLLVERLRRAGYEVRFAGYWNMFLLPVVGLLRLCNSSGEEGLGLPSLINSLLVILIRIEVALMHVLPLPFGVSVVAVATPAKDHERATI